MLLAAALYCVRRWTSSPAYANDDNLSTFSNRSATLSTLLSKFPTTGYEVASVVTMTSTSKKMIGCLFQQWLKNNFLHHFLPKSSNSTVSENNFLRHIPLFLFHLLFLFYTSLSLSLSLSLPSLSLSLSHFIFSSISFSLIRDLHFPQIFQICPLF